jgi:methionine-rich copper-binding protein CopC
LQDRQASFGKEQFMIRSHWLTGAALLCCTALAQAHTHVAQTMPAEGSTVQPPKHLVFHFSEAARLTSLNIQREGEAARKIEPLPSAAAAQVMVAAPPLANGKYTVTWRAMGKDEHIVSGSLNFTVSDKAAAATSAPKPAAPAGPANEKAAHQH